ncbi:MAG: M23 family metallopeptidase [Bacteroidales bacterium]|nr:M23 family metallopeptidase [Bacteroidales bacterium]
MPRSKFKVNLHSLEFEKVTMSWRDRFRIIGYYTLALSVFAVIVLFVAYSYFPSPRELMLMRENKQYALQFELLNEKVHQLNRVLADLEERDDNIYRTIFETEPIPKEKRIAGIGGSNRYEDLQGYNNAGTIIETSKKIDVLGRRLYIQSKSYDELYKLARSKEEMLASIPAIQPISNKDLTRIASGFGFRIHPVYKTWRMHTGIDFTAPTGTPIYATGDGKVINPQSGFSGYGKTIVIDHGFGYQTLYAHCSKIIVKSGQKVKRGQIIGYVGNTGISTGPHVHYEVLKNGEPVNPVNFFYQDLSPEEYEKVIEISSRANQAMS